MWLCQVDRGWTHWEQYLLKNLSYTISSRAGGQSVSKTVSIPFVVLGTSDGLTQNVNYYCQAPPPMCLPQNVLMRLPKNVLMLFHT